MRLARGARAVEALATGTLATGALATGALVAGCAGTPGSAASSPPRGARAEPVDPPPDEAGPLRWRQVTMSPQPAPTATGDLAPLQALCGAADGALADVAAGVARALLEGPSATERALDMGRVSYQLRARGAPYVWPRVWTLVGGPSVADGAAPRLKRFAATFDDGGVRRCGLGDARGPRGRRALAALVVDVQADLDAFPVRSAPGRWHTLEAHFHVDVQGARVVLLGPRGAPREVAAAVTGRDVKSSFSLPSAGQWRVQLVGDGATGPRPVAKAIVHVGTPAPGDYRSRPAPGEGAAAGIDDTRSALLAMVNGARSSEGRSALGRHEGLDAVAQAHAEAMRDARKVGHDVGDGGPRARVAAAGLHFRRSGENVAHAGTLALAHRTLWASPSHRDNLLVADYDVVGLGVAEDDDGTVWVALAFAGM